MLSLPASVRIFAACARVDFRKGFDGLVQIVRDHFGDDPLSGHLYLFFNARRNRLKILVWDRNGFWLFYKRLEQGTFEELHGSGSAHRDRPRSPGDVARWNRHEKSAPAEKLRARDIYTRA